MTSSLTRSLVSWWNPIQPTQSLTHSLLQLKDPSFPNSSLTTAALSQTGRWLPLSWPTSCAMPHTEWPLWCYSYTLTQSRARVPSTQPSSGPPNWSLIKNLKPSASVTMLVHIRLYDSMVRFSKFQSLKKNYSSQVPNNDVTLSPQMMTRRKMRIPLWEKNSKL